MKKALVLVLLITTFACTQKAQEPAQTAPSAAAPVVLNLAIWSNYVTPETLAEFEKQTGIKVQVSNYSSNEELLAKLQAGGSGYDVAVPSDYMVFAMIQEKLLTPIDRAQIPHSKGLNPKLMGKSFDPENKYSLPFDFGTTGIAVNMELYKGKDRITSWKELFSNKIVKGKFTLLDDVRETTGAVLKYLGKSLNTRNPKDLAEAKKVLLKLRGQVKAFTSETKMDLISGETMVAHAYSSDALQARKETGGKIEFNIPTEGATLWLDNLVIPVGAPHPKEALRLIDFLLEPKVAVNSATHLFLAPSNLDALSIIPADLKADEALFPPDRVMGRLEMMEDLGEATEAWDKLWTEVKADAGSGS